MAVFAERGIVVEVVFRGGMRDGQVLRGQRAAQLYDLLDGGHIGATFRAKKRRTHRLRARKPGDRTLTIIFPPITERYIIVDRKVRGKKVTLRARRVP